MALGLLFFFALGLLGVAILIGAARTSQTSTAVIGLGLAGGFLMFLNCAFLHWAAGLREGTSGDRSGYLWYYAAVAISVISLIWYAGLSYCRLSREKPPASPKSPDAKPPQDV